MAWRPSCNPVPGANPGESRNVRGQVKGEGGMMSWTRMTLKIVTENRGRAYLWQTRDAAIVKWDAVSSPFFTRPYC